MVDYISYVEDLQRYLASKFPSIDASACMEAVEYISHRTARLMVEVINDRDKEWERTLRHPRRGDNSD